MIFKDKREKKSDNYYQEASDWYHERYELNAVSKARYQVLSIFLLVLLALSMTVSISLLPLKQYVYRLIAVNQTTGEVLQLNEIDSKKYETDWVVTRYFIHQYVLNRHSYSIEDIKRTFNLVLAMSAKHIADDHMRDTIDTNPQSPLNVLNNKFYREVTVLGINKLNDETALVRFKTVTHDKQTQNSKTEDFQAVVKWSFQNVAHTLADRDKNPLGFMVNYYQVSPVVVKA